MASPAVLANPGVPAGSAFSPIALFECTISNAQMLIDSMELLDLILAQKIVCQLHGRLVDVMEPTAGRMSHLAELYSSSQRSQASMSMASTSRESLKRPRPTAASDVKQELDEDSTEADAAAAAEVAADGFGFGGEFDADDEDRRDGDAALASPPLLPPPPRLPSQLRDGVGLGVRVSSVSGGGGSGGGGGPLSDRWKQLLRKSYRMIKDQRGEVFDFTKSYSAPVNLHAADVIIQKALSMTTQPPPDATAWKSSLLVESFMRYWFKDILRRNYRRQHQPRLGWSSRIAKKLSERQRSLDNLLAHGAVNSQDAARMRALLDPQYVSSDDDASGPDGQLRVKRLPWESAEAAQLKATLDGHFAEVVANPRERQELSRVARRPDWVSGRPLPDNPLGWAVSGWQAAGAAAAASSAASHVS